MTRPAYGTRQHFDWSANGDGLPEMEPCFAEEPVQIVGTGTRRLPAMSLVLCFVLTVMWAG